MLTRLAIAISFPDNCKRMSDKMSSLFKSTCDICLAMGVDSGADEVLSSGKNCSGMLECSDGLVRGIDMGLPITAGIRKLQDYQKKVICRIFFLT